jgi:hypothetical protein
MPCNCGSKAYYAAVEEVVLLPKNPFRCLKSVLDKSKARFRRLQNSSAGDRWRTQTLVIADLALRQVLLAKTLSMAAQTNTFGQQTALSVPVFQLLLKGMIHQLHIKLIHSAKKHIKNVLRICW